jgi:hypothetical protein
MAIKTREQLQAANTATFGNGKDLRGNDERSYNADLNDSAVMKTGDTFEPGAVFEFDNGSQLREGTIAHGFGGGISRVCTNEKEDQWEDGVRYLYEISGSIVYAESMNNVNPDVDYDESRSFAVGSRYKNLVTGIEYLCTSAADGDAVWFPAPQIFSFDTTIAGGATVRDLNSTPVEIITDTEGAYYQILSATVVNLGNGDESYDFAIGLIMYSSNGTQSRTLMATLSVSIGDASPSFGQDVSFNDAGETTQFMNVGAAGRSSLGSIFLSAGQDATVGNHSLRIFGTYVKFPS